MLNKILSILLIIPCLSFANDTMHIFESPFSMNNYDTPMYSYKVKKDSINKFYERSDFFARLEVRDGDYYTKPYVELLAYIPSRGIKCNPKEKFQASIFHSGDPKNKKEFTIVRHCNDGRYNDIRTEKQRMYLFAGDTQKDRDIFANALKKSIGNAVLEFNDNILYIPTTGFSKAFKNKEQPKPATKIVKQIFTTPTNVYNFYGSFLYGFSIKDNNSFEVDGKVLKIIPEKDNEGWYPEFWFFDGYNPNVPLVCYNKKNGEPKIIKANITYPCENGSCKDILSFEQECEKDIFVDLKVNGLDKVTALKIIKSDRNKLINLFNKGKPFNMTIGSEDKTKVFFIRTNYYTEHIKKLEKKHLKTLEE